MKSGLIGLGLLGIAVIAGRRGGRLEAAPRDIDEPSQFVMNNLRDLYRKTSHLQMVARRMRGRGAKVGGKVAAELEIIDGKLRRLSMQVDDALGIDG